MANKKTNKNNIEKVKLFIEQLKAAKKAEAEKIIKKQIG